MTNNKTIEIKEDIGSKEELMSSLSKAFGFPEHFGNNWDALFDYLTDFSGLEFDKIVLVHEGKLTMKKIELKIYLDLLEDTRKFWDRRFAFEIK